MIHELIKAKFQPKDLTKYNDRELACVNRVYDFKFAFCLDDGSVFYECDDARFTPSNPISITELEIVKEEDYESNPV